MSSGIAIGANAEDPLSDHSSHLDSELSIPTIDIKRFRLHLLRKVTNGEHVGMLHIVLNYARLTVNKTPRHGLQGRFPNCVCGWHWILR